ncbi:MAG TPA: hypothetical protein VK679_09565 [Gemmatimonadaceae bacterium]|nr:hypothetical protein [Gemmatimonadaceae bacterium]
MKAGRVIAAIALADVRERVRRYSFLATLLFATFLGYAAATGKIVLHLDEYRGVYTAGWIGLMVALVTTVFVSLIGFYIVKNSVDRDRTTGVGQTLAATPVTTWQYTLGKLTSNFLVLASIVLVQAVGAVAMFFVAGEDRHFDAWALLSPLLLVALPAMAFTAAIALLFECLPLLRAGVGNVLWFFLWTFAIALPQLAGTRWFDPIGVFSSMAALRPAARAIIPGYKDGMSLTIVEPGRVEKIAHALRWPGIPWTTADVLGRLLWVAVAGALALLAALVFDRFDATRGAVAGVGRRAAPVTAADVPRTGTPAPVHLTPLARTGRGSFGRLVLAELRLALKGFRWWWYAGAAGLVVAQIASPLDTARGPVLATAWLWPIFVWSAMGTRESRYGMGGLLFSCPRMLTRELPACFLAGVIVALLTGIGVGARLALIGHWPDFVAWLAGALFLPSLALALGVVSGTSKTYEGLLTVLWYIGPLQHVPGFDFTGAADGPLTLYYAGVYFALSGALLFVAFLVRASGRSPAARYD